MKAISSFLLGCVLAMFVLMLFVIRSEINPYVAVIFSILCGLAFIINELVANSINKIDWLADVEERLPTYANKFKKWCLRFSAVLFMIGFDFPDLLQVIADKEFNPSFELNRVFIVLACMFVCLPYFAIVTWGFSMHIARELWPKTSRRIDNARQPDQDDQPNSIN